LSSGRASPWGESSRPSTSASCATLTRRTSGGGSNFSSTVGESRHALARWLFFANREEFRSGDYEEIMNKASCLSLLSNAVLVWNTMVIMKIITELRPPSRPSWMRT
jgi:TnpA family transposase